MNLSNWTQKYLKEAIDDEIALAKAKHGGRITRPANITVFTELVFAAPARTHHGGATSPRTTGAKTISPWRRDWRAAGHLATELRLNIRHDVDEGTISVDNGSRRRSITEAYADHPGMDEAVVAAIVRAAIQIYTELRESA